ncbi:MAG: class I SAM-dependent methyltransferase [Odoribacter sp.]
MTQAVGVVQKLKRLLKLCPQGKIYGIDLSEDVAFAKKYNKDAWIKRCFIRQGNVLLFPL